jgi:hypothetical protein
MTQEGETKPMRIKTIIGILIAAHATAVFGGEQPPKPPEIKVLEKFVGTWDCEMVMKPAGWTPKEVREKSVEVNEIVSDLAVFKPQRTRFR